MQKKPSIVSLVLLAGYAAVSAVLFTPSIPDIRHFFSYSHGMAQAIVSLFLLGYTLGQWLHGPVTQFYGRKRALYMGIALSTLGSLLSIVAIMATSGYLFLLGRFVQALGASAGLIVALAIIHDVYTGVEARQKTAYLMLAFSMLPGVAVSIGGLVATHFMWEADFALTTLYAMALLILTYRMPETAKFQSHRLISMDILVHQYVALLRHWRIVSYALIWGTCTAVIYALAAILPIISVEYWQQTPGAFSIAFLNTSFGLVLGNIIAAKSANHINGRHVMFIGVILGVLTTVVTPLLLAGHGANDPFWLVFVSLIPLYTGMSMIISNASVLAAQNATNKTTASSLVTLINLAIAVLICTLVEAIPFELIAIFPWILRTYCIVIIVLLLSNARAT